MFINKQINDYADIFKAINDDHDEDIDEYSTSPFRAFATNHETVLYYAHQIMAINDNVGDWIIDENIAFEVSYALAKAIMQKLTNEANHANI